MRRNGITLVELLVSISVVAILVAITLPAVQYVREGARRAQCQNNVRQVLLATQSHHDAQGKLPSFYNGTSLRYPLMEWDLFQMHSWRVPLLPYLEQGNLLEQVKWDALATAPENAPVAQTAVSTFLCPSGGDPMQMGWGLKPEFYMNMPDPITDQHRYWVVRSDYDAMAGIQVLPDPLPRGIDAYSVDYICWGIWGWPVFETRTTNGSRLTRYRSGMFRDVTDGLSNTISVVERGGKPKAYKNGKLHITSSDLDANYPGQVGWSVSNTFPWSINGDGVGVNQSNSKGIYSFHRGGANLGIADGSVRFLSDSTDFEALVKLYGRSDGGIPDQL